ncbi:CDP-glucose 4,6-dehydratase [Candidatus Entotheonella palauensis]|uniref:CDP-glucose 4,6-dehydratase n=1 Tax=Candidatus Entotheonella palauensis TaxID=93172 RepID=UPI000B7F7587|nr:CDP-glucose 4,6-dehydratase [Candidatus Entotheonella palauensis]
MYDDIYKNKTVCVTGHTGFKGSWLCEWLLRMGAHVAGYALEPPSAPSHAVALHLGERLTADIRSDVQSLSDVQAMLQTYQPDFIFHLAAQPIVRRSFDQPYETIRTNCMGSLNVLEAVRQENRPCVVIMVTSDKVYENVEWVHAYRENDLLGGHDPYSASKACAETVISTYRRSFFQRFDDPSQAAIAVASARGGNVIGGGDWAEDRIVPDCMRHLAKQETIPIRNRVATRPWQHVLELLNGYLRLGAEIYHALYGREHRDLERLGTLCSAFNFGPNLTSNRTVAELVQEILKHWPGTWQDFSEPNLKHEAYKLHLSIDKSYHLLNWKPLWDFQTTIKHTVEWYMTYYDKSYPEPEFVRDLTRQYIELYQKEWESRQQVECI